ncbi:MAG: GGDEF domain-containing response regulator [Bacillota bacterium]
MQSEQPIKRITEIVREEFLRDVGQKLVLGREALDFVQTGVYGPEAGASLYWFANALKGSAQVAGLSFVAELAAEMSVALLLVREYGIKFKPGLYKFLAERFEKIEEEITRMQSQNVLADLKNNAVSKGKTILLVNQNNEFDESAVKRLQQEGLSVCVCTDVDAAVKLYNQLNPDLMILDAGMAGGKGLEISRRLRSDLSRQAAPLILITDQGFLQEQLLGFATRADDHITWPIELNELVDRIHDILLRAETIPDWEWMDNLSGIYNRRYLNRQLNEEINRIAKSSGSFSLAVIDIDALRQVNDAYGYLAGDQVLMFLASKMLSAFRTQDIVCRYGGEEFVVLLPETPCPEAQLPLERLRRIIEGEQLEINGHETNVSFTISAGLAVFPEDGLTGVELLTAAETALYWAKEAGGNRVLLSKGYSPD